MMVIAGIVVVVRKTHAPQIQAFFAIVILYVTAVIVLLTMEEVRVPAAKFYAQTEPVKIMCMNAKQGHVLNLHLVGAEILERGQTVWHLIRLVPLIAIT